MRKSALLLLSLAGLGAAPSLDFQCDRECHVDLARATTRWALEVVAEHRHHDLQRTFLDIGPVAGQDPSGSKVADLARVARESGITARNKRATPAWESCREGAASARCRAARGTTSITLDRLRFPVADQAEVRLEILILGGFGGDSNWAWGRVSRVRLVHEDGAWSLLDEEILWIS